MGGQLARTAELDAAILGTLAALAGTSTDQVPLERASPARIVIISSPCSVVVSAHGAQVDGHFVRREASGAPSWKAPEPRAFVQKILGLSEKYIVAL